MEGLSKMKRYIKSARSESDYDNTAVLHINLPKADNATYSFIESQLLALSEGYEDIWYAHVDSQDQYTVYINADKSNVDQIKNLIQNKFNQIASVLTYADIFE